MGWIEAFRLGHAAAAYARKLPKHLARAYGRSRNYTSDQITAAARTLKLDPTFIAVGLAAFLEEADYMDLRPSLPRPLDYEVARAAFVRALPGPASMRSSDEGGWGAYTDATRDDGGGNGGGHH